MGGEEGACVCACMHWGMGTGGRVGGWWWWWWEGKGWRWLWVVKGGVRTREGYERGGDVCARGGWVGQRQHAAPKYKE